MVMPLANLLARSKERYPDRRAFVMPGTALSYRDLWDRSMQVACGIASLGIEPRAHVGILANNSEELVSGLFGIWLADCVAVPISARNKALELRHVITDADLAVVLTTARDTAHVNFPALLAQAFPDIGEAEDPARLSITSAPGLRSIALLAGEAPSGFLKADAFARQAKGISFEQIELRRRSTRATDTAAILYTSGTTSKPKGCMLCHEALSRGPVERANGRLRGQEHDVTWGGGPLFHIGSLGPFIGSVGTGGTYLADVAFDAGRALKLMYDEGVTIAWPWFPALMEPILDHPEFDASRLERLSKALIIAPEPLVKRAQEALPSVQFLQACGMTETAGIFALSDEADPPADRARYQGRPVDGIETRIVDPETGADLADGQMGEILVRGYCVMNGYYKAPKKTAEALSADGWLHTGDFYRRGKAGQLQFCGRIKDMLKVGGENVAALEIEAYLTTHSSVRVAQVIGMPDKRLVEVPVAFVELNKGRELSESELIRYCVGRIASFKVPRAIYFLRPDQWPMSLTKIDKRGLRQMLNELDEQAR